MKEITISVGDVTILAQLNDSRTARLIWEALPIEATAHTWGDEVYFEIPVVTDAEADARAEVEVGDLGYWPVGHALCIFFGPTPVSTDEKPRAYSPVMVVGQVVSDSTCLRRVRDGDRVRVARAGE